MIVRSWPALAFVLVGCSSSPLGVGDQFSLAMGERASIAAINLSIRFLRVPADSRCPAGADCITAGDATVLVEVAPLNGDAKTDTLHTDSDPRSIQLPGVALQLVRLDPYPRVGQSIPQNAYVLTLVTHPAP
jgi:hypothetical protein